MKHALYILIAVISSGYFFACEKDPAPAKALECNNNIPSHPKAVRFQQILKHFTDQGAVGVSVAVISPEGTWTGSAGKADLQNNLPLTPCHTLRIGSATKMFTAAAILKLQEQGKLRITDKIKQYIPESVIERIEKADEVTIAQCLNHSSGIKDYLFIGTVLGILNGQITKKSAAENLERIYDKTADKEPMYSNSNYLLLALIIEQVTGKPAYEYITQNLIQPLGLSNTSASTFIPPTLSRGYYDTYNNGWMKDLTDIDHQAVGGQDMLDGGMIATPLDMATFLRAMMQAQVISQASLDQMQQFRTLNPDILPDFFKYLKGYGLGLMDLHTDYGRAFGHGGNVHTFNCVVYHFPETNTTVAIHLNSFSGRLQQALYDQRLFQWLF